MSDDLDLSEELQAATIRELQAIRSRLTAIIVILLLPFIAGALALMVGIIVGLT